MASSHLTIARHPHHNLMVHTADFRFKNGKRVPLYKPTQTLSQRDKWILRALGWQEGHGDHGYLWLPPKGLSRWL